MNILVENAATIRILALCENFPKSYSSAVENPTSFKMVPYDVITRNYFHMFMLLASFFPMKQQHHAHAAPHKQTQQHPPIDEATITVMAPLDSFEVQSLHSTSTHQLS